jgi:hypothetical protein
MKRGNSTLRATPPAPETDECRWRLNGVIANLYRKATVSRDSPASLICSLFFSKNPTELRKSLRILRGWSSHFRPEEGLVVRTARLLSMPRFMIAAGSADNT